MFVRLKTARKANVTAGTELPLVTAKTLAIASSVKFYAPSGNTGIVYIGDSTVSATNGIPVAAGAVASLADFLPQEKAEDILIDLSLVYVDAATSGDAVVVSYLERSQS